MRWGSWGPTGGTKHPPETWLLAELLENGTRACAALQKKKIKDRSIIYSHFSLILV